MKHKLEEIIENILEEILFEANTSAINVGTRIAPNTTRSIGSPDSDFFDSQNRESNSEHENADEDENKKQTSKRSKNKNSVEKFMWGGDDPNNVAPKIKYIAT